MQRIIEDLNKHSVMLKQKMIDLLDAVFEKYIIDYRPVAGSQAIKKFCRQIERLHDALEPMLPTEELVEILLDIHLKFKQHVKKGIKTLNITQDGSPQYVIVLQDVQNYTGCLSKLKALEMEAIIVDDIWDTGVTS